MSDNFKRYNGGKTYIKEEMYCHNQSITLEDLLRDTLRTQYILQDTKNRSISIRVFSGELKVDGKIPDFMRLTTYFPQGLYP